MFDQESPLHWLECGLGPLILVSGEYVTTWSGYTRPDAASGAPSGGLRPAGQTDYERACAVEDDLGLVEVGGGQGLVIAHKPMAITWWTISPTEGILVCWMYGEDEAPVIEYLAHITEQLWEPSGITYAVGIHPLYIFDTIMPGREATEYLAEYLLIRLGEGQYDVDTGIARPDTKTGLILHRFRHR